jgi:hypothetical protein
MIAERYLKSASVIVAFLGISAFLEGTRVGGL